MYHNSCHRATHRPVIFKNTFPRISAEAWQTDSDQRTVFKVDYLAKLYDYRPATYVFLTESLYVLKTHIAVGPSLKIRTLIWSSVKRASETLTHRLQKNNSRIIITYIY
jgi:hypothetical protein